MQRIVGVAERMEAVGRRSVLPSMPEQHRAFMARLYFLVAGSVDAGGAPWATILAGHPGFVSSPTPTRLDIAARPAPDDPAGEGMGEGEGVGLLGIEPHTRRRNRVNGIVRARAHDRLGVEVGQSFGNCPQYIRLRDLVPMDDAPAAGITACGTPTSAAEVMENFDAAAREAIAAADTLFVASYFERDGARQVDVSHRGGRPGFVCVGEDGTLTVPDFAGNMFFMTLGNILSTAKAGLVVPDWATGDLLQLTGDASVVTDPVETAAFRGAERLWTLRPRRVVRRRGALPLRWATRRDGQSPNALATGDWRGADAGHGADLPRGAIRGG